MSHDTLGLTVSYSEAARLERETTRRLVQTSKLSLIVDLDQCVIQTTVDPTVGEWLKDESNPNHPVLQDVQQFRIAEEGPHAPIYYVKPRPGLSQFFSTISKRYEMHIYTMGTKPYARKVASVIDPDGIYFGSRILSRDENGSNTQKSVQRLFPVETNMVVIMDDRGDVWQWSPNLIKVQPFEFFVGIGDINSSFLPALNNRPVEPQALVSEARPSVPVANEPEQSATLVSNVVVDDPEVMAAQADAQTATLEAQVEDRPLARRQEALIAEEKATGRGAGLLKANDNELYHLERTLKRLHEQFYKMYNVKIGEVTKDRNLAKLNKSRPWRRSRGQAADVKSILPDMKRVVLQDVVILFSGLIRSDRDPRREWQGQLAVQFGARVLDSRSREKPTHIIVGQDITVRNMTEKAKMYKTFPWIKVVYLTWLTDSASRFERLNEQEYQVDRHAPHVPRPSNALRTATEDGQSDTESIVTDNGITDRLINEASKTMDWNDMEGEMQDFLGDISDDATTTEASDDSDASSTTSSSHDVNRRRRRQQRGATPTLSTPRHKRMRSEDVPPGSGGEVDPNSTARRGTDDLLLRSPLSKRRNMAKQRRSGLAHSVRADSIGSTDSGGRKPPAGLGEEEGKEGEEQGDEVKGDDGLPSMQAGDRAKEFLLRGQVVPGRGVTDKEAPVHDPSRKGSLPRDNQQQQQQPQQQRRDEAEETGEDTSGSSDTGSDLDDLANELELQLEEN